MFTRLMVTLERDEAAALDQMADSELRDPRDQLRMLLREAARTRGLLPSELPATSMPKVNNDEAAPAHS